MRSAAIILLLAALALPVWQSAFVVAQPGGVDESDMNTVTPEREAAAMTFASRHHPELAKLLERLETADPDAYRSAIQDLFKDSERLARVQGRTPERFETEVELWKVDSRIRLLAARAATRDRQEYQEQLQELLSQQRELRLELLKLDRQRFAARLERIDASIETLQQKSDDDLAAEADRLITRVRNQANTARNTKTEPTATRAPADRTTRPGNAPTRP